MGYDPNLTPARPDLAADFLQGKVEAAKFVAGRQMSIQLPAARVFAGPDRQQHLQNEWLLGETITTYEHKDGWVWAQATRDGFVGYVDAAAVGAVNQKADHWVSALRTPIFDQPDLRAPTSGFYHQNSLIADLGRDDHYMKTSIGWIHIGHVRPLGDWLADPVEVASSYLHAPYLWGGRTGCGLDCSSLIQLALHATGRACPRDAYMQEADIGDEIPTTGSGANMRRGDLVFWKGHVGIMTGPDQILHANGTHMACTCEPLEVVVKRMLPTNGSVTSVRRFL